MTHFLNLTLGAYSSALASDQPTPGGGTACAVALADASALSVMVSKLTLGRDKWKSGWGAAEAIRDLAEPMMDRALELADLDSAAFEQIMAAFALPKDTEEELNTRRNEIRAATIYAAEVPLETAQKALDLLRLLPKLASAGNGNAVTDVGVACLLADAACQGALFNVRINIGSLPENISEPLQLAVEAVELGRKEATAAALDAVERRMQDSG